MTHGYCPTGAKFDAQTTKRQTRCKLCDQWQTVSNTDDIVYRNKKRYLLGLAITLTNTVIIMTSRV